MLERRLISHRRVYFSLFDVVLNVFMFFVVVITLYPFLNILAKSLNDPIDTVKGGITIFPRVFTLDNYRVLFEGGSRLPRAFQVSVLRTVIGALLGVLSCAMFAYPLSRDDFVFKKSFSTLLVITMYVSGGLIPGYLLIRSLGLINSFWVYIIPGLINAFNVIVIRSYIDTIPPSLQESARIDGANDITIFFKIILPLCTPVLATIGLFIAVGQWNSWFDTYLYARGNENLTTLQYELMKVLDSAQTSSRVDIYSESIKMARKNPEAIKMAITMVATLPIVLVYPFLQRYFVTGITLGAIKE
ncbi:carbohydrate ABC transporter permease [Treponema sp. J25]|jgi:putative aldouronate transport system permease protein|uniref:carbohydrate ABC transporter permease n=1 Tax=Treponema sp. J25 TaxID=2094121 RepID=UPI001044CB86|nr:carbohydrate ABC transporter permease [Treponema sp. J25]TCW62042.1 sugar ABC transporter permease [Treponema sp. J25]